MVGGNIPGKTKVISIEIYDRVEVLEYAQAHILSAGLLLFSFLILVMVYSINRRLPVHVT
jgi:molybdate transport system permease protein